MADGDLHILNYRLVDSVPSEKPYYVYIVDVQVGSHHRCIERRYSQFHSLHRKLRKQFHTPVFPPKRVRCSQPRLLEQRRRDLELYLRTMLQHSAPSRSQILNFLGLNHCHSTTQRLETLETDDSVLGHWPIFTYQNDPYVHPSVKSGLSSVVIDGMLQALYNTKVKESNKM